MPVLCLLPCSCRWRTGFLQDLGVSATRLVLHWTPFGAGSAAAWETGKATGYHSTRTVNGCKQCTNENENISSHWRQRVWNRNSKIKTEWNKNRDLQLKLAKYTLTQDFFNAFVSGARPVVSFQILDSKVHHETLKEFQTPKKPQMLFFVFFSDSCFNLFPTFFPFLPLIYLWYVPSGIWRWSCGRAPCPDPRAS